METTGPGKRPPRFSLQGVQGWMPWRRHASSTEAEATLLADVVGALVHHLTIAQAQADHASVQLGEAYAQHPWLARFPVPSMAVREVEVTLPVLMAGTRCATPSAGGGDGEGAEASPDGLHVLYTAAQLQGTAPEHIATIKLTLQCAPKRLVTSDGKTTLVP